MLRAATPSDAIVIAEIYNYYIANTVITFEKDTVSPGEIEARILDVYQSALPWVVIEHEGEVRGYAYATKWRSRPAYSRSVETTVYISHHHQGKGLGRMVYADLLADLKSAGLHTALGGIALPNSASVRLHETLGFQKTAHFREVGYKFDRWIDVGYWQVML